MKTRLEKFMVCDQCYSFSVTDADCHCTYGKYKAIQLEFEVCDCCHNLIDDGSPAETKFNEEQFKKHESI